MIQLEDKPYPKRCGHLDGKAVVRDLSMQGKRGSIYGFLQGAWPFGVVEGATAAIRWIRLSGILSQLAPDRGPRDMPGRSPAATRYGLRSARLERPETTESFR